MKIVCPCCQKTISFSVNITEIYEFTDMEHGPDWWKNGLTSEQLDVIARATKSGIVEALRVAVEKTPTIHTPKSMERFFLALLKTMRPKRVPQFALDAFIAEFGGQIAFWSAQGMGLVTSNGAICMFIPLGIVTGVAIGGSSVRMNAPEYEVSNWIRTRMGYVPRSCRLFLEEMKNKSYGEFSLPSVIRGDAKGVR